MAVRHVRMLGVAVGILLVGACAAPAAPSAGSLSTGSPSSVGSGAAPLAQSRDDDGSRTREIDIVITGSTGQWSGQTQQYMVTERFSRRGTLIVEPDPDGEGYEVAVFAGNFASTSAGDMHFVTNTYLYRHTSAASFVWTARVPVGTVSDGPSDSIVARVDEPRSRIAQLSSFIVKSAGLYTNPKQIVEGEVRITELDGSQASGEIELYASGAIEPGNSFPTNKYLASFRSD